MACHLGVAAWAAPAPPPSASAPAASGAQLATRALTVVLDDSFPPYVMRDAAGELQGYLPERWRIWQARTGVAVQLRGMDWAQAQQVMREGGAQVIDTIARTPAREALYDFSAPHSELKVMLFFRAYLSGITDAASARDFTVGVKDGDRCVDHLAAAGVQRLQRYPSYAALARAALRQEVVVFCMNEQPADDLLTELGLRDAFMHTAPLYTSELRWAVRKGDAGTLARVSDGFARIDAQTQEALQRKWFGEPLSGPLPAYLAYAGYALLTAAGALLVEDNELNQEVALELLRDLGLEVDLAPDGAKALAQVQRRPDDVVLMDMQMPVMDGLTATREIRRLPGLATLPIIAMTANAMSSDRQRCLDAGMNEHLAKPIDPQLLANLLHHWVPAASPARASGAAPVPAPPEAGEAADSGLSLGGIAGFDAALGLRQSLGREDLYRHLLASFVQGQTGVPVRIAAACSAGDWLTAERLAHTLKGVAAQVGATTVRSVAWAALRARLLEALETGDPHSLALFDEHAAQLRAVLGSSFERVAAAVRSFEFLSALDDLRQLP
ncbi:hypothetical protein CATMQ487_03240 [Sphaerotilus microaerophilus]|uniref:Response regulatory domain-containing protein n=1 Tax=Sphaerotilus microaerophilus TaxID=2914710 RepID=A0ABM7YFB4_9BURK|nr:hypothetical protein CATMQ487_03240 [Sphaerotilus sp. FB-5]